MANTTLGAIVERYNNCPAANDTGPLFSSELDESKIPQLPGTVVRDFVEVKENTTEPEFKTEVTFALDVYTIGGLPADAIQAKIDVAFDMPGTNEARAAFNLTGGKVIGCEESHGGYSGPVSVKDRDMLGRNVYLATRYYMMRTVKTRAT